MKKLLVLVTLTLSLTSLSHAQGLKDYVGCYKTLKIDGQTPNYGTPPEQTLSSIETGENPYFRTLERKRLNHVIVNLYLGSRGDWHSYHPFVLFPEVGTTQIGQGVLTHHMSDDLIFYDNYRPIRVDHNVDLKIERINGKKISGFVSYRSNSRDIQGKRSFLLEKTSCR